MGSKGRWFVTVWLCLSSLGGRAGAAVLGSVGGRVLDPQGSGVPGVTLVLLNTASAYRAETVSDSRGNYIFGALQPGEYRLTASITGFKAHETPVVVSGGSLATIDVALQVGDVSETVHVSAELPRGIRIRAQATIDRGELQRIPGALQAGSLAAILETTPSAVMAHDQIHVRGGHQIAYQIDGIPVPSNSIGSNFALMFDPKDAEALEFQRGAFNAELGDRMYGLLNVVTRSGFERARSGEAMLIAGGQNTVDGAVAYGDHTDRVAYFGQISANRTDFGLTPPSPDAVHNRHDGAGGATKLWFAPRAADIVSVTGSVRADDYEIPHAPDDLDAGDGLQSERDVFVNGLWTHAGPATATWSVAPYFHFNRAELDLRSPDAEAATADARRIRYGGAKADWVYRAGSHAVGAGTNIYGSFLQDEFRFPQIQAEELGSEGGRVEKTGVNSALYVQDHFQPASPVTIDAGLRWDRSSAYRVESMFQPRAGIVIRIPRTPLSVQAYAGRFFQVPPLEAIGVGAAQFVELGEQAFLLVRGERDTSWQAGVSFDLKGGVGVDVTYYQTHADNYLDHEQLGNSALFLPVNIEEARLRGLEISAHSPPGKTLSGRLVFARGYAEGRGDVTGGLGDLEPRDEEGYFFLDHDQRYTAVASLDFAPTPRYFAHLTVLYGSGFLLDEGPDHLPSHTTANVSAGVKLGRRVSLALEVENLTDKEYVLNLSSEFNGTHYARPRYASGRIIVTF